MTKYVLVLDDSRDRVDWLRAKFPDISTFHVESSKDAIETLEMGHIYDLTILDHDLGETDNGMEVVKWLEREYYGDGLFGDKSHNVGKVLVWSCNPVENRRMAQVLTKLGIEAVSCAFGSAELTETIERLLEG